MERTNTDRRHISNGKKINKIFAIVEREKNSDTSDKG